jgi:hypothetical protein
MTSPRRWTRKTTTCRSRRTGGQADRRTGGRAKLPALLQLTVRRSARPTDRRKPVLPPFARLLPAVVRPPDSLVGLRA